MKKILLVAQGRGDRSIIASLLKRRGAHVIDAEDDASAGRMLNSGAKVDLVVVTVSERDHSRRLAGIRETIASTPMLVVSLGGSGYRLSASSAGGLCTSLRGLRFQSAGKHGLVSELDRQIRIILSGSSDREAWRVAAKVA